MIHATSINAGNQNIERETFGVKCAKFFIGSVKNSHTTSATTEWNNKIREAKQCGIVAMVIGISMTIIAAGLMAGFSFLFIPAATFLAFGLAAFLYGAVLTAICSVGEADNHEDLSVKTDTPVNHHSQLHNNHELETTSFKIDNADVKEIEINSIDPKYLYPIFIPLAHQFCVHHKIATNKVPDITAVLLALFFEEYNSHFKILFDKNKLQMYPNSIYLSRAEINKIEENISEVELQQIRNTSILNLQNNILTTNPNNIYCHRAFPRMYVEEDGKLTNIEYLQAQILTENGEIINARDHTKANKGGLNLIVSTQQKITNPYSSVVANELTAKYGWQNADVIEVMVTLKDLLKEDASIYYDILAFSSRSAIVASLPQNKFVHYKITN